jgi:tRNA wybutosine-synthesizing protein 1
LDLAIEGMADRARRFLFAGQRRGQVDGKLTGRKRAFPVGMGDARTDANERLEEWRNGVEEAMRDSVVNGSLGEGVTGSGDAVESDEEDPDNNWELEETADPRTAKPRSKKRKINGTARVDDLEDIGARCGLAI